MLSNFIDPKAIYNNRLDWIDYAKGIAITMVVYRHVLIGLSLAGLEITPNLFVTTEVGLTFRMPLFFLLSGIFFSKSVNKRSKSGYFWHKFKTIMYPYFIWSVLQMSLQMMLINYTNAQFTSFSDFLLILFKPRAQFWFLYALFNVSVLYLLLSTVFRNNKLILFIIGVVLLYFSPIVEYGKIVYDVMRLFVFFVVGDIASQFLLDQKNHKLLSSKKLTFFLLLIAVAGEWIIVGLENDNVFILLTFAIIGSAFTVCFAMILASVNSKFLLPIRVIGYHSLYIFLLHAITSAAFRIIMVNFFGITNVEILLPIGTIIGVIGPVLIYSFCAYYGMWFLFTPDNPNKKKTAYSLNKV